MFLNQTEAKSIVTSIIIDQSLFVKQANEYFAMSIWAEVGELVAELNQPKFRGTPINRSALSREIADVIIFCIAAGHEDEPIESWVEALTRQIDSGGPDATDTAQELALQAGRMLSEYSSGRWRSAYLLGIVTLVGAIARQLEISLVPAVKGKLATNRARLGRGEFGLIARAQ
jgi:hypothetical protein